jgi:hypothetical protein
MEQRKKYIEIHAKRQTERQGGRQLADAKYLKK